MYGQQITVQEQLKDNPSIFNNTGDRFLLQNRIPLTMILEPIAHFNQNNTSSTTVSNAYTEFRAVLGEDQILDSAVPVTAQNTFGQSVTYDPGDIIPRSSVGTSLKVDRIYDVYIESITTFNTQPNNTKNSMAFKIEVNDWNIDNNTNLSDMSKSIVVPNETSLLNSTQTHKAKKLNYLTHLTPDTISFISGNISLLDGSTIFNTADIHDTRISIELVFIPRNKN